MSQYYVRVYNIYIIVAQVTDPGPLNKYEYVSCSKVLKLDPVTDTWTSVFRWISTLYLQYLQYIYNISTLSTLSVRPETQQNYTLYGAVPSSINLKRIKAKNGHLVSCNLAVNDVAE